MNYSEDNVVINIFNYMSHNKLLPDTNCFKQLHWAGTLLHTGSDSLQIPQESTCWKMTFEQEVNYLGLAQN